MIALKEKLMEIRERAEKELSELRDATELENFRVQVLGKKGELTGILKQMGSLSAEERPKMGQLANEVRASIEAMLKEKTAELRSKEQEAKLKKETIDVTLPGKKHEIGHKHPLSIVLDEVKDIFVGMGFQIATGPEVEWDYYNFEALNLPPDHPARYFLYHGKNASSYTDISRADSCNGKARAAYKNYCTRQSLPL